MSAQPDWMTLPCYILEDITHAHACLCGGRAVWVGRFKSISGDGNLVGNAMLLCEGCALDVDGGVTLERLKGRGGA
jgi:hypothetical protein